MRQPEGVVSEKHHGAADARRELGVAMDEAKRLGTIRALGVLDSERNADIDRITRVARLIFKTPIALVTLIDAERQWFKSCLGLDVTETSRDVAFCAVAIEVGEDVFEVPDTLSDTLSDPRFADNPFVTGPPYIRYYIGAPIVAPNGARLGTVCLIDTVSRPPADRPKRLLLRELAAQAMREIEIAKSGVELDEVRALLP